MSLWEFLTLSSEFLKTEQARDGRKRREEIRDCQLVFTVLAFRRLRPGELRGQPGLQNEILSQNYQRKKENRKEGEKRTDEMKEREKKGMER